MPASQVRRILPGWLCSSGRQCAQGAPLTPTGRPAAGNAFVLAATRTPGPLALEVGGVPESESNGTKTDKTYHRTPSTLIKAEPSQRLLQLRRGADLERASYEMLAPMASPSPTSDVGSDASAASAGVSAFVARVLDQLALSAWLPAAFLSVGVALLLEFRSTKSASILNAVGKLTAHPVQVLVIMIPLLVIATVVTQAFSFEAIRTLEGYWRRRGLIGAVSMLMIRWHVHRKKAIIGRRRKESAKAFRLALPKIILDSDELTGPIARAIEGQLTGSDSRASELQGKDLQVFVSTIQTWRNQADAWRLARIDRLLAEQKAYPVDCRVMPTKLGNLIRATEDELKNARGDIQSFVLRQRNTVSQRIQMQHDQFRTRLDMYCTLVFVSAFLVAMTPAALIGHLGDVPTVITAGSFAAVAVASYLAAIASASGYCTALMQMDEATRATDEN